MSTDTPWLTQPGALERLGTADVVWVVVGQQDGVEAVAEGLARANP